jgi:transcriptional regulator with XRE-family HTH domain
VNQIDTPLSSESLCVRLRRERERRQIALSSISANTKISASLFESLERGDVSRWPSGIYRRSFIRAYANAIGLDADATAKEFLEQFPDPHDESASEPAPAAAAAPTPIAGVAAPAAAKAVATEMTRQAKPARTAKAAKPTPAPVAVAVAGAAAVVRVRVEGTRPAFSAGRLLDDLRRRAIAAACDGGVVVAIALCGFVVFDTFWLPLAVTMLAYYLGGILVLGNTPGVCLLAAGPQSAPPYNQPADEPRAEPARTPAHPPWHFRMPAR